MTITSSCLLAMVTITPARYQRRAAALAVVLLGASVTMVIQSGMHRPSDVFAAPILALTWVACLVAVRTGRGGRRFPADVRGLLVGAGALAIVGLTIGSSSLRSEAGGPHQLPAQAVINHASYGALITAYAVVIAVGVLASALLEMTTRRRDDRSATSIDTVRTSAA